jgi:hypothetical protein
VTVFPDGECIESSPELREDRELDVDGRNEWSGAHATQPLPADNIAFIAGE